MKADILIVEDESIVAMEIEEYLTDRGHRVIDICSSADEAYTMAVDNDIDLILMDIALIESSGIDASRRIREVKEDIPIIFLTAFMDEEMIDRAIEINPVAYITKPFNFQELMIAIKIALKQNNKSYNISQDTVKIDNEFSFNLIRSELIFCGEAIRLTKKEKTLLQLFLDKSNQIISNELIEYTVWGDTIVNDNARRILISRLRAKLKHKFIQAFSLEGYIFRN